MGVKCYVATPVGDYDKSKAVIFLCDVFGLSLKNNLVRCSHHRVPKL
jgi:hypothetical protein